MNHGTFPVRTAEHVVLLRREVCRLSRELSFPPLDETRLLTATSELARNTYVHGGGGEVKIEQVAADGRQGLRITFRDRGPGIVDTNLAMRPGYTTTNGLGLGLPGAKRLVDEFALHSTVGEGTVVSIVMWV